MKIVFPATSVLQYFRQFRLKILCKTFWESSCDKNVENALSIRGSGVTNPENISG